MNSTTLQGITLNKLFRCTFSQFYRPFVAIPYQSFHLRIVSYPHINVCEGLKAFAKTLSCAGVFSVDSILYCLNICNFVP